MHLCAEGVRELGVDLKLCYLGNLGSIRNILRARDYVRRLACEFDIVHAQFGSACAFATAGATNIPKVLSLCGSDWYRYKETLCYQAIHGLISTAMTRLVIRNYDTIITMSHRMEKEVKGVYPNLHVQSFPSPVSLEDFKPINKQDARTKLGFSNDGVNGFFSHHSTDKPDQACSLGNRGSKTSK